MKHVLSKQIYNIIKLYFKSCILAKSRKGQNILMRSYKILAVCVMSLTFFNLNNNSASCESVAIDKSGDTELQSLINEVAPKFTKLVYAENGVEIPCNVFLPENYPGHKKYPLVFFMADGSTVGKETDAPLKQGLGGIIWASQAEQEKRECIVIVPQYPKQIVDDQTGETAAEYIALTENLIRAVIDGFQVDTKKIYVTGQSMGCMALMIIADKHPDLFTAELFVAGQGNLPSIDGLKRQKFFYVTAEGDELAVRAQDNLIRNFQKAGVKVSRSSQWDAKMSQEEFKRAINVMLSGRPTANFARFVKYSVIPKEGERGFKGLANISSKQAEHEFSFDAAYRIDALRDWLFMQEKSK